MIRYLIALLLFFCAYASAAVPVTIDGSSMVAYADKHINSCGTLKKTSEGFVYLKVSEKYVDALFPMLQDLLRSTGSDDADVLCKPPYVGDGKIGTHVSVIYVGELPKAITSFPEKGRKECFSVSGLAYVDPDQGPFQRVYYLRLISAGLGQIRMNYRLDPLYLGHDFHITIGVVYKPES